MNKFPRTILLLSALIALGGCVAVPVQQGYYEPAPVVYVPAPVYYGPSISFGIYGGRGGPPPRHYHRGRGAGRGHR